MSEDKKLTCDEFIQKFKGKSLSEILEAMNIDFTKCKGVIPESTADLIVRKNSFFEKNYAVANNNYNSQYSRVCKGNYCGYDFFLFDYCDIFSKSTILEIMIKNYNLEYIDIYSDSYKIKEKISCIAIYTAFIGYIIFCVSLILKYGIDQIIYVSNFPVWFIASVGLLFYAYKYYKQYRATQKKSYV